VMCLGGDPSGDYEKVVVTESRVDGVHDDMVITPFVRCCFSDVIGVIKSNGPLSSVHERRSGKKW
jgi:hypothetical protein